MTAQTTSPATDIDHIPALRILESEAVHIIREVVAELENPVLLFSGGKDSIVLLHLAEKAFRPHPLPFPILRQGDETRAAALLEFFQYRFPLDIPKISSETIHWHTYGSMKIVVRRSAQCASTARAPIAGSSRRAVRYVWNATRNDSRIASLARDRSITLSAPRFCAP